MLTKFIELHDLSYHYTEAGQQRQVLDAASLVLERGEIVALLGRSGAGKSTLLNVISGIDRPTSGVVRIDDIDVTTLTEKHRTLFRRTRIGFIYQFFNLIDTLTASENVALPLELAGSSSRVAKQRATDLLESVDLGSRTGAFPDQLSGGERQRVAIARALVHQPDLVLADEPSGNLDAKTGELITSLMYNLARHRRATLLVVTHSLAVANNADRIVTLEDGKLYERAGDFAW